MYLRRLTVNLSGPVMDLYIPRTENVFARSVPRGLWNRVTWPLAKGVSGPTALSLPKHGLELRIT